MRCPAPVVSMGVRAMGGLAAMKRSCTAVKTTCGTSMPPNSVFMFIPMYWFSLRTS